MRGVFQSEPQFLAIFSSLSARRSSVRTEIPGDISQFAREVFVGQDPNLRRYSPVEMRGIHRSELKFLAIFPSLGARRFSVRTQSPGNSYQFEREAVFGQNPNSWRYFAICARGVFGSEPKFLATVSILGARRFSARTRIRGCCS